MKENIGVILGVALISTYQGRGHGVTESADGDRVSCLDMRHI